MKNLLKFLTSKTFFKNLLFIILFFILCIFLVMMWLRFYTNHGQKLALPSYEGYTVSKALDDADDKSFEIIIKDSIHVVGKPGGIILNQNPIAGAKVKEGRKIYVTTTKFKADTYKISDLPKLYGSEYNQKKADLSRFKIKSSIKSTQYDPGEPNHILEVYYKGKKIVDKNGIKSDITIEKGSALEFVVSDRSGGQIIIPNLVCKEYAEAEFFLKAGNKLSIGKILDQGVVTNRSTAIVVDQYPKSDGFTEIEMGSKIDIILAQERPVQCGGGNISDQ